MSKAIKGDYDIPNDLRTLNNEEMQKYILVDNIDEYSLYNLVCTYDYILGYFKNGEFKKVAKLYLNKIDEYPKCLEVDTIYVSKCLRGEGISTKLYTYMVKNLKYNLISANTQRFGARKLWSKLSRMSDLPIDIIDFDENIIIEKDVILKHGNSDEEFDRRVWSYDNSTKHIRLILNSV